MRYLTLATDYDGTIATDGQLCAEAASALRRLRHSGRRAILVTGRRLDDLLTVCPQIDLFDYVVAENGALVYSPRTQSQTLLGKAPSAKFIECLRSLGVDPIEVGQVMLSTWLPNHVAVLQAIQETGLALHVIFNREAVMVLPNGISKMTGLDYALRKLGLSFHEAVGVGDAQNDHPFLERCECAVAVANAVPSVKRFAAFVTQRQAGEGVAELIDELIADDLVRVESKLEQHFVTVGLRADGTAVKIPPYGVNVLVAGPSGSGKSTVVAGIVERLIGQDYQVCIIDPEGDYGPSQGVITLGSRDHAVSINEVLAILEDPKINLNVNLLGIQLADRPVFFGQFFPGLRILRTRTARPHWVVLDEAHHLLPLEWGHLSEALPQQLGETILVTVQPDHLPPTILSLVDVIIAVGKSPDKTLRSFSRVTGAATAWPEALSYKPGQAVIWFPRLGHPPFSMSVIPGSRDRIRHRRKYSEGNMLNNSFYFRGPAARQNLKAQNLAVFAQLAEGIDEETWLFHLYRGDYSRWFREAVKDPYLADQAERIEQRSNLQPAETRSLIRRLIDARYTLPG
jgi:hydroxymethylpyrimidine pyrophosphatase-like HAD family hydrolase/energy-coupling factor transporter ATP-binding protein EcfA2